MPKNALQTEILAAAELVAAYYTGGTSSFFFNLGVSTAIAGGFQEIAAILSPTPEKQAVQAIVRSTTANMQIVYGQVKTGGVVCFSDTYGGATNPYLCVVIAHTLSQMNGTNGLGVSSVKDIWIDNIQIPDAYINSSTGVVTTGPTGYDSYGNPKSPWNPLAGQIIIKRYDGSQAAADGTLTTNFSTYWGSTAIGKGVAYTMVQLYRNPDDATFSAAFPRGIPGFVGALVNGQKVYDPRSDSTNGGSGTQRFADPSTWTFSSNPALCAIDLLTRAKTDGGQGIGSGGINWPSVAAAANICDENVTLPGYGATWNGVTHAWSTTQTTPRYSCNIALDTGTDVLTNLQTILDCMAGHVVPSQGQLYIYAGVYDTASSVELNEDCLAGPISVAAVPQRAQTYNMVKGTYCEPLSDYQTIPAQPLYNSTYETQDGGIRLTRSLSLPGVNNQFQAQYLEIVASQQSRNKRLLRAHCNLRAMQWKCWDVVPVTIAELGLSSAPYRILNWQLNGDLSIDLLLQEEASTTYDFALSQFTAYTPPTFYLMGFEAPAAPSALTLSAGGGGILLTWTAPADNSYLGQSIERAPDVSGSPGTYAVIANGVRGNAYSDTGTTAGSKYWYRIRAYSKRWQYSSYCTAVSATATTATSNADHTASNTSNDTSNVSGIASSTVATSSVTGTQRNGVPDSDAKFGKVYWGTYGADAANLSIRPAGNTALLDPTANGFQYTGTGAASSNTAWVSSVINVQPGSYTASAYIYLNNVLSGSPGFGIYSTDQSTHYGIVEPSATGRAAASVTIPSGVTQVVFVLFNNNCTVSSGGKLIWQLPQLEPGTAMTAYRSTDDANGYGVLSGSGPVTVPTASFAWTATSTSISWSWSSMSWYNADGSNTSISNSSVTTSSLSTSTTYKFYPYYDLVLGGNVAWVNGGSGSNGYAFSSTGSASAASAQNLAYRIPLADGGITATTGGAGGTKGGFSCLHPDMEILTKRGIIRADDLLEGDEQWTPDGWQQVTQVSKEPQAAWIEGETNFGERFIVTPSHSLYDGEGNLVKAEDLRPGHILKAEKSLAEIICLRLRRERNYCIKHNVLGHLFYAREGGILQHNGTLKP